MAIRWEKPNEINPKVGTLRPVLSFKQLAKIVTDSNTRIKEIDKLIDEQKYELESDDVRLSFLIRNSNGECF
jgi:hypothetical protein